MIYLYSFTNLKFIYIFLIILLMNYFIVPINEFYFIYWLFKYYIFQLFELINFFIFILNLFNIF